MTKKHDLDRLEDALKSLDQIDADLSVARRASAADVVREHVEKIRDARDRGYSVSQIANWIAIRAGCSTATVKSAISRVLMNAKPHRKRPVGASSKDRRSGRPAAQPGISTVASTPVQQVTQTAARPVTAPAQPLAQPVAGAAPTPVVSHALTVAQPATQPAPTGIHAIVSGLSQSPAQSSAHPEAQRVA